MICFYKKKKTLLYILINEHIQKEVLQPLEIVSFAIYTYKRERYTYNIECHQIETFFHMIQQFICISQHSLCYKNTERLKGVDSNWRESKYKDCCMISNLLALQY